MNNLDDLRLFSAVMIPTKTLAKLVGLNFVVCNLIYSTGGDYERASTVYILLLKRDELSTREA
jgi:hypothetical protein